MPCTPIPKGELTFNPSFADPNPWQMLHSLLENINDKPIAKRDFLGFLSLYNLSMQLVRHVTFLHQG
jgi:hypothetical protein